MANPEMINCPADVWTKVATDVTSGQIKKIKKDPNVYLETYRMTGGTAPTSSSEGVPIFNGTNSETITAAEGIDVYIWAVNVDGRIRADL